MCQCPQGTSVTGDNNRFPVKDTFKYLPVPLISMQAYRRFRSIIRMAGTDNRNRETGGTALDNVGANNPELSDKTRLATLLSPFISLDGINEKGVSIAVLTLDSKPVRQQSGKPVIATTLAIRLILDRGASTEEAVTLFEKYDMFASSGRDYHFYVTDSNGDGRVIVGLMSGVLSNTGTAAVLIPVVIGIAAKSGYSRSRLLMPLVFAAAMGGNLSLIGAPGNLIAQSVMEEMDMGFGFFEYAKVGLPILVCGIIYFAFFGYKLLPNKTGGTDSSYDEQKDFSNVPKWKQALSLIILILTLLGMIFEDQIGIKLCITGCIGALALILTGVISEKNALKSIDLKTIFLFGGTLSLASALQTTGAGEDIAKAVIGVLGENPSPYILTFVVFMLCCVLTNFMSNTATTALMAPICVSIAQGMGADPRAVLMACVIGGSCAYATPIGMPANTMVVTAGGYTFKDYAKAGVPLILVATVVSMILLPILYPFFP